MFVSQAALQSAEKETSKATLLRRGTLESLVFEKMLKKRLGQILRIGALVAAPPQVNVNGWPVNLA